MSKEFIFRTPSGEEVGRAKDLSQFKEALSSIPSESLEYHLANNHFTPWLTDHKKKGLAKKIEKSKGEGEKIRNNMIKAIDKELKGSKIKNQWI